MAGLVSEDGYVRVAVNIAISALEYRRVLRGVPFTVQHTAVACLILIYVLPAR